MTEERITRVETPAGDNPAGTTPASATYVRTEVVRDAEPASSRGGMASVLLVMVVVAALIGGFVLMQGQDAEIAKDNAIAGAADSVGNAADSIGNAADQAAEKIAN